MSAPADKRRRRSLRAIGLPFKDQRPAPEIDWTPRALIRLAGGAHIICLDYVRGVIDFATEGALKPREPVAHDHSSLRSLEGGDSRVA